MSSFRYLFFVFVGFSFYSSIESVKDASNNVAENGCSEEFQSANIKFVGDLSCEKDVECIIDKITSDYRECLSEYQKYISDTENTDDGGQIILERKVNIDGFRVVLLAMKLKYISMRYVRDYQDNNLIDNYDKILQMDTESLLSILQDPDKRKAFEGAVNGFINEMLKDGSLTEMEVKRLDDLFDINYLNNFVEDFFNNEDFLQDEDAVRILLELSNIYNVSFENIKFLPYTLAIFYSCMKNDLTVNSNGKTHITEVNFTHDGDADRFKKLQTMLEKSNKSVLEKMLKSVYCKKIDHDRDLDSQADKLFDL